MEYAKKSLSERNKAIQAIAVVLNTLDEITFPVVTTIVKSDLSRFNLINRIQDELAERVTDKLAIYDYFNSLEQTLRDE
jgi:hypothetical protein